MQGNILNYSEGNDAGIVTGPGDRRCKVNSFGSNIATVVFLSLAVTVPLVSNAATSDYDGKWNVVITCGVNSLNGRPGFTNNTDFNIVTGKINETKVASTQLGKDENAWSGQIQNGRMNLNAAGKRDNGGSWEWRFTGKATSNESIALDGAMLAEGKQIRDCSIKMSLIAPASTSLVSKAKNATAVTPPVAASISSAKVSTAEKPTQSTVSTAVATKVEKAPATVEAVKQTQTTAPVTISPSSKEVVADNAAKATAVMPPINADSGSRTEAVGEPNKEGTTAVEQQDSSQPVAKVEPPAVVAPQKSDASDQFNWGEILQSSYVKYGFVALLAVLVLWIISILMRRVASNVKDASKNLAASKDAIKQGLADKVTEAKIVAAEKLQTAKAAASEASAKISEAATEASRAASKKIDDNSENIENAKSKFKSVLSWFEKKWAPYKSKILNSKFGGKYPRLAKVVSNGWVIFGFAVLMSGGGSSDPYERYNNSKDYKSCVSAAKAAGRKLAREEGSDEKGTIQSLQSSCGKEGAEDYIEVHQSAASKAANPICQNQMAAAKNSCMGAQGNSSVYYGCIRANTPACN